MDDFFEFNEIETQQAGMEYLELPNENVSNDRDEKEYVCVSCDKHYQAIDMLHSHMKEHEQHQSSQQESGRPRHGEQYQCDFSNCSKTFSLQAHLEKHVRGHIDERIFECNYENCSQKFNFKSNLKRHEKVHTQEKPFLCQQCERSFTTTTNLKQHLQIHMGQVCFSLGQNKREIYECTINGCNKKYFYLCNLKKHKKEHSDDKQVPTTEPQEVTFSVKYNGVRATFNSAQAPVQESSLYYRPSRRSEEEELDKQTAQEMTYRPELVGKDIAQFISGLFESIKERPIASVVIVMPTPTELKVGVLMDSLVRSLTSLPTDKVLKQVHFCELKKEDVGMISNSFFEKHIKSTTLVKDEDL